MQRYTITLGASTTAGWKVISASSQGSVSGVKIALEGDLIFCRACKSQGKILCVGPRIPETWNGKQVALGNDMCLCGCFPSPRLVANQTLRSQVIGESEAGGTSVSLKAGQSIASSLTKASAESYDLEFLVLDTCSGLPVTDWPYNIELASGQHLEGKTDKDGKTSKVAATHPDNVILRVYEPESTPVNPFWDR
ncbi:PAAR domain-containing protein [Duganella fentianensis]|nr:PAAR domain-containing protein [Duganella fentianensis]